MAFIMGIVVLALGCLGVFMHYLIQGDLRPVVWAPAIMLLTLVMSHMMDRY
jgi:hypothetical protein